jgi:hypothetical protein
MDYRKIKNLFLPIIIVFFALPLYVFSANIHVEKNLEKIPINEEFILKIYLDTKGQEINVIEGSINIDGIGEILSIEKDSSIFTLWPNTPEIFNNRISFVGGSPGGVFGSNLKVFDIKMIIREHGQITLASSDLALYLNDGIGTKESIDSFNYEINTKKVGESKINRNTIVLLIIIILLSIFSIYKIKKRYKNK